MGSETPWTENKFNPPPDKFLKTLLLVEFVPFLPIVKPAETTKTRFITSQPKIFKSLYLVYLILFSLFVTMIFYLSEFIV